MNSQEQRTDDDHRWALAIAGSNDGVWDWNLNTGDVFFSDRWKSMLGYAREEVGHTVDEWSSRVHPDDVAWVMEEVGRHLKGETELYQSEHRVRHKDGHYLWILDRGRRQLDEKGQAVRMTGFHTDVTERRQAQEAAQDLNLELSTILNLSPDGFVAFDRKGCVKYVNPAFVHMTGLVSLQVQGLTEDAFFDMLALQCQEHSRVGDVTYLRSNLISTSQRRSMLELLKPVGRILTVRQQHSDASSIAKILCFRDVTYETEVDRLKSEFISTAAHELRSPLASIYGFAEALLTQKTNAATRKEFLGIIHQQSQTMTHLLNEMLDLARIEARRRSDCVFVRIPVQSLIKSVLSGFKVPDKRLPVVLSPVSDDLDLDLNLYVKVDFQKASQVLVNVLSNAYKYSPNGGTVQVELESIRTTGQKQEVGVLITDAGIGMTPAQVARVFERFYRANPCSKIPGTGLGMSIVKEIMNLLDGRVDIQSEIGKGTRVSLFFPCS